MVAGSESYKKRKREWAKTESQREYRRNYMRSWREKNREKHNKMARESHFRHREKRLPKQRERHLSYFYGISLAQYDEMLRGQGGVCKICKKPSERSRRRLAVDHCHITGKIRGLLCGSCNTKLGFLEKFSKEIIEYLK